jgi:hypothetical protein
MKGGLEKVLSTRGVIDAFVMCLHFEYPSLALQVLMLFPLYDFILID